MLCMCISMDYYILISRRAGSIGRGRLRHLTSHISHVHGRLPSCSTLQVPTMLPTFGRAGRMMNPMSSSSPHPPSFTLGRRHSSGPSSPSRPGFPARSACGDRASANRNASHVDASLTGSPPGQLLSYRPPASIDGRRRGRVWGNAYATVTFKGAPDKARTCTCTALALCLPPSYLYPESPFRVISKTEPRPSHAFYSNAALISTFLSTCPPLSLTCPLAVCLFCLLLFSSLHITLLSIFYPNHPPSHSPTLPTSQQAIHAPAYS